MTAWSSPGRDHQPGTCESQPIVEGDSGTLVYDCDPESADGCFIPRPA